MKSAGCQSDSEHPPTSPVPTVASFAAGATKTELPFLHVFALGLAFGVGAAIEAFRLASLHDLEIWRHLRMGSWMFEKRALPHFALFSQASNLPWRDANWGYDLLVAAGYRILDLRVLPAQLMFFRFSVAVVAFLLAGGRRHWWRGVFFALVAQYILGGLGPEPAFCSVLLFGIELFLLSEIRRQQEARLLYALPLLFLVWANLDGGVVYGIGAYALFFLGLLIEQKARRVNWTYVSRPAASIPLQRAATVGIASVIGSLLNPYGYYPYVLFFANQRDALNVNLPGHAAMGFHSPRDYAFLLLTMAAFLILGRQHSFSLFPLCLLVGSASLAFRSERCVWLAVMASVAVMGEMGSTSVPGPASWQNLTWPWKWLGLSIALGAVLACAFFLLRVPHNHEALMTRVARQFPQAACDYIHQNNLPKPLFNPQNWGSFVMWYLPEYPVAIDGRRGLYSEQDERDYSKVMKADIPYQTYAPMRQAQTLLLEKTSLMGEALRDLAGFQLVYEDDLAIVLLRQQEQGKPGVSQ